MKRFFSPSTGRKYLDIAEALGVHAFSAAGWSCTLARAHVAWRLEARFVGTRKQRQDHRAALADIVKGLVPEGTRFKITPIKGGHQVLWPREWNLAAAISEAALHEVLP